MSASPPPVDLDQLERAYEAWGAGGWGAVEFSLFGAPQAVPALIAELRDLRARDAAVERVLSIWDDQHNGCGCSPKWLARDLRVARKAGS